jgi:hypothetical protein
MKKLIEQSLFAEVLNELLEKLHTDITTAVFMLDDLHHTMSEGYFDSPQQYLDNFHKVMSSADPKSKVYPELKNYIDMELQKFTGKVADKNDGETQSTMSGLTKKSLVKGQTNALAEKSRMVTDSPSPRHT